MVCSSCTRKLALPSFSQIRSWVPVNVPWFNRPNPEQPCAAAEDCQRHLLPRRQGPLSDSSFIGTLVLPPPVPTAGHSPRGAVGAGIDGGNQSQSAEGASEPVRLGPVEDASRGRMNQPPSYMDVHSSHFSAPQSYASHGATAGPVVPYSHYQQQPPVLQGSTGYPSATSYSYPYANANGIASPSTTQPPSGQVAHQMLPLPRMLSRRDCRPLIASC